MKEIFKKLNISDDSIITLEYFLKNYFGIRMNNLNKLRHADLHDLNISGVKRVPFDILTKNDILGGSIFLVEDVNKNLAPYINPQKEFNNNTTYYEKELRRK
jgi:hypothetical protein